MAFVIKSGANSQLTTPNLFTIKQDGSGNLGIYNTSGVEVAYFDVNGNFYLLGTTNTGLRFTGASLAAIIQSAGDFKFVSSTAGKNFRLLNQNGAAETFHVGLDSGIVNLYGTLNTVGLGVPPIYANSSTTGNTGAVTNAINYTPPATAGSYRLSIIVNVTAWTTPATFTIVVTYKDASGVARTETLAVQRGSTGAVAAAITAIDRWYAEVPLFQIDNSATAITVSTSGTFTGSPVYNFGAVLEQLA